MSISARIRILADCSNRLSRSLGAQARYNPPMTTESLSCPDCTTAYQPGDNYCRKCGMYLAALHQLPMVTEQPKPLAPVERQRATLPAPVKKAATALAIGTALQVGMGLAGKYLAAQSARTAANAALRTRPQRRRDITPAPSQAIEESADQLTAVSETVMIQRTWIRRG